MLKVIDTATTQRNMDFGAARREGWVSAYVKMGGDNVGRYVAPHYVSEVDRARAAGMRVGHYWVPNANYDPVGAADYFVDNLRGWTSSDYAVLDNESLDGARHYSDAQAAAWIERVKARLRITGKQVKHYAGLHDARSNSWPKVLATGANFIIAAYSYAPFAFPPFATVPSTRIDGHQYSSSGTVGGVTPVDLNAFKDTAFDYSTTVAGEGGALINEGDREMRLIYNTEDNNDATRRAVVGEFSFQQLSPTVNPVERKLWGAAENVSQYEWNQIKLDVEARRKAAGLPAGSGVSAEIDSAAVAKAVLDGAAKRLAG